MKTRPYPKKYKAILANYLANSAGSLLFRKGLVEKDASAVSPEQAMYEAETYGICAEKCSDPSRFEDYKQGKSCLGLLLKDLQDTRWRQLEPPYDGTHHYLYPEELIATNNITRTHCMDIWGRAPDNDLLIYWKSIRRYDDRVRSSFSNTVTVV